MTQETQVSNVRPLRPQAGPPPWLQRMLDQADWEALEGALQDGRVKPNAMYRAPNEDPMITLYEIVLMSSPLDIHKTCPAPLPIRLLDAMIEAGLENGQYREDMATPVGLALYYGQYAWAEHLLDRGYAWQGNAPEANVIFDLAVGRRDRVEITQDFNPHFPTDWDAKEVETALTATIRTLVSKGASVNSYRYEEAWDWRVQDYQVFSLSPLALAVEHEDPALIRALMANGAKLDEAPHSPSPTALWMAAHAAEPDDDEDDLMMVDFLLGMGADPMAQKQESTLVWPPPLLHALRRGAWPAFWHLAAATRKEDAEHALIACWFVLFEGDRAEDIPALSRAFPHAFLKIVSRLTTLVQLGQAAWNHKAMKCYAWISKQPGYAETVRATMPVKKTRPPLRKPQRPKLRVAKIKRPRKTPT